MFFSNWNRKKTKVYIYLSLYMKTFLKTGVYIYIYINIGSRKKTTLESVVVFLLPIFISRSTLTYRALYYGKIETQTSYI